MTSPGLSDFLLARIAEDEDAARRAAFGYGANWTSETDDGEDWSVVHADGKPDMVGCEDRDVTGHIAWHDPARVLAECVAKRRIVRNFDAWRATGGDNAHQATQALFFAVCCLAQPYKYHPDYRSEFVP